MKGLCYFGSCSFTQKSSKDREVMKFNNPMNESVIELMAERMTIMPEHRLLEVGCGEGAFLEMVAMKYGCGGLGVDIDGKAIDYAQKRLLATKSKIIARCQPADINFLKDERFDHAVCIGSSGAFGKGRDGVTNTLAAVFSLLPTSGMLLLGELYWKKMPPVEYLNATGLVEKDMFGFEELVSETGKQGFLLCSAVRASDQDWDLFESAHLNNRIKAGNVERAQKWFDGYCRWGKDAMGFCLLLLQKN